MRELPSSSCLNGVLLMSSRLIIVAIIAASVIAVAKVPTLNPLARYFSNTATEAANKMASAQLDRTQKRQEQEHRKQRLANIVGCSTDTSRKSCKCYDRTGSVDIILSHQQCLAVVDRGLAALNDF